MGCPSKRRAGPDLDGSKHVSCLQLPQEVEAALIRDLKLFRDVSGREDRVLQQEIDDLGGSAAGSSQHSSISLTEVDQLLGLGDGIRCLDGDSS